MITLFIRTKLVALFSVIFILVLTFSLAAEDIVMFSWSDIESGEREPVFADKGYTPDQRFDSYNEAPELAAKVEEGILPPVEERLPDLPVILPPKKETGSYGGTIKTDCVSGNLTQIRSHFFARERLFFPNMDLEMVPNVAKGYQWNEDKSEITIYLRKGMKWSDGELFTADDILFYWNDYLLYSPYGEEDVTVPTDFRKPGTDEPMDVEKIDDYTVKFKFDSSNPLFLQNFSYFHLPEHALKEYLPRYNDKTGEEAQELYEEFGEIADAPWDYKIPTLNIWVLDERISGDKNIYRRNPYYWKVDPEGNQLPYIDKVEKILVSDREIAVLKATQGFFDIEEYYISPDDLPVLHDKKEDGNYEVFRMRSLDHREMDLNWNTPDKSLRELIHKRQFRIAISHAIDREKVNQLDAQGLMTTKRTFITPQNPNYELLDVPDDWREMYIEYDPDKANKILDELGLEKGKDGIRRYPGSDEKIKMTYLHASIWTNIHGQLIKEFLGDIGIEVNIRTVDFTTWVNRVYNQGSYEITSVGSGTGTANVFPYTYKRLFGLTAYWAPLSKFENRGSESYQPIPEIEELHELWLKGHAHPDPEKRNEYLKKALELHAKRLYKIPLLGNNVVISVKRNDLHNCVPMEKMLYGARFSQWQQMNPAQWFTTRGE